MALVAGNLEGGWAATAARTLLGQHDSKGARVNHQLIRWSGLSLVVVVSLTACEESPAFSRFLPTVILSVGFWLSLLLVSHHLCF